MFFITSLCITLFFYKIMYTANPGILVKNLQMCVHCCWILNLLTQVEMEEREERKRMQELRDQEKQQEEERERLLEQKQVSQQLDHICKNLRSVADSWSNFFVFVR